MIDLPFEALGFLSAYVAVTVIAPRLLDRPRMLLRHPNVTIGLWLVMLVVAVAFLWLGTGLIVAEWFQRAQSGVNPDDWASSVVGSILTWLSLAMLGIIVFRLIAAGQSVASERAEQVQSIAPLLREATRVDHDGQRVYVVASPSHLLAAAPFANAIVISSTVMDSTPALLLRAAIEHERAHLVLRHSLLVSIAQLAVSAAGGVNASRRLTQTVRIAIELVADDWAARRVGPLTVADALDAIYPANPDVAERVARLRAQGQ